MDASEHEHLRTTLSAFKSDFLEHISESYRQLHQTVEEAEHALINTIHHHFTPIEDLLTGPYDRRLQWDWVAPVPGPARSFLDFKVRLRDMPEFELSAQEYLNNYVKSQEEIAQALDDLGYHLPPTGKLFAHFLTEVIEGRKLLIAKDSLRRVNIPQEQIPLALMKAQNVIAADRSLHRYLPSGTPQTLSETLYFLEVINSFHLLQYKVILPISEREVNMASELRTAVFKAASQLNQTQVPDFSEARMMLQEVQSPNLYGVSEFVETLVQCHAQLEDASSH